MQLNAIYSYFIHISSLNFPEMRPYQVLFDEFYQTVPMETVTVTKIIFLISVIRKFYKCSKLHYHQVIRKKTIANKNSQNLSFCPALKRKSKLFV